MYDFDLIQKLLPEENKCAECGGPSRQRCSQCKKEWYCSKACQIKAWRPKHKAQCVAVDAGAGIAVDAGAEIAVDA